MSELRRRVSVAAAEAQSRARLTEPIVPFPNSTVAWRRRCLGCGRVVDKPLRYSCSYCSTATGTGRHTRLPNEVACARAYRVGQQPLVAWQSVGNTLAPWRMRCLFCGEAGPKMLSHIHRGVGICAGCATFGFDPTAPAEVYVVTRAGQTGKFGIGGLDTDHSRVAQHLRDGWQVFARWEFDLGAQARYIERQVAKHVRSTWGIPVAITDKRDMPHNGGTETFDLHACSAEAVRQLIESRMTDLDNAVGISTAGVPDRRRARQTRAFAEARAAGAEPAQPYPGSVDDPWQLRCFVCGTQRRRQLARLREERGCASCTAHARRTTPQRAAALTRTGFTEPLFTAAPATAHAPFPGRCFGCGQRHNSLRVANFLAGQGGCSDCGSTRSGQAKSLETAAVQRRFLAQSLVVTGQYVNNWTRLPCRCLVCGASAELLPQHVFTGTSRCPTCERARLVEQYRTAPDTAAIVMLRGGWYPLVAYTNAKT